MMVLYTKETAREYKFELKETQAESVAEKI